MVFFIFIQILIDVKLANSGIPDQAQHSAASDQGLHCLRTYHKKEARRIRVKLPLSLCLERTKLMISNMITMISDNDKVHTVIKLVSEEAIHETFDNIVHLT